MRAAAAAHRTAAPRRTAAMEIRQEFASLSLSPPVIPSHFGYQVLIHFIFTVHTVRDFHAT